MERCIGMMVVTIKGNGRKECRMVRDLFLLLNRVSKKENLKIMYW